MGRGGRKEPLDCNQANCPCFIGKKALVTGDSLGPKYWKRPTEGNEGNTMYLNRIARHRGVVINLKCSAAAEYMILGDRHKVPQKSLYLIGGTVMLLSQIEVAERKVTPAVVQAHLSHALTSVSNKGLLWASRPNSRQFKGSLKLKTSQ